MVAYAAETCGREVQHASQPSLVIAFVNNMPDAAIKSTERQFRGLLQAAAGGIAHELKGYYCPEVPRSDAARAVLLQPYQKADNLWNTRIDGLIVTGAEPRSEHIADDPYWPFLAGLIDWAEENTVSTIWSCLAAHAAVFRISGIARKPLASKLSGLFECTKVGRHPLTEGVPEHWLVPQSRYNGLPQHELAAQGFQPLTKLASGFDSFVKQAKSLFVFFQGHPEYDPESLLFEYIRDVKRFNEGFRETYPEAPAAYFDRLTLSKLEELREEALQQRSPERSTAVSRLLQGHKIDNVWRSPSTIIFQNWLKYLSTRKEGGINPASTEHARNVSFAVRGTEHRLPFPGGWNTPLHTRIPSEREAA